MFFYREMLKLTMAGAVLTVIIWLVCLTGLQSPALIGMFFSSLAITGYCAVMTLVVRCRKSKEVKN